MSAVISDGVPMTAAADSFDDLVARAEQAVARLQGQFEENMQRRLQGLPELFERRWRPLASRRAAVQELRRINHDIKGEAGTFGYDILGDIAELFSAYLREVSAEAQSEPTVSRYVDALADVWTRRLVGDGGEPGRRLLVDLARLNPAASTDLPRQ
jgi:chemotaxis protein histidine kinase CheA